MLIPVERPSSNFWFIQQVWPDVFEACVRAERYLAGDPRTACIWARRAIELLVDHLYDLLNLPEPYQNDLAARSAAPAFRQIAGEGIVAKLRLIRRVGNTAVHEKTPIIPITATQVLRELYHVAIWAAFNHSAARNTVPQNTQYDPTIARPQKKQSQIEIQNLLAKFKRQDENHARELAERQAALELANEQLAAKDTVISDHQKALAQQAADHEAEIEKLRAQIAAIQAASQVPDTHDYDEAATRSALIDLLLHEAGWPLDEPRDREFPVRLVGSAGSNVVSEVVSTGSTTERAGSTSVGRADYVLWGDDGKPLAVVEAKRTSVSPSAGEEQARQYADALEQMTGQRPIIFYTNGYETWMWDDAAFPKAVVSTGSTTERTGSTTERSGSTTEKSGSTTEKSGLTTENLACSTTGYPPRRVSGFFTKDELTRLIQRRTSRASLTHTPISTQIAGRGYQQRAIRAIDNVFEQHGRKALLVMATGTGKTRVAVALVKQLMDAGWIKRVLFLADRTALVRQAVNAFKQNYPAANPVNLLEHKGGEGRVYVSTYQTMMGLIDKFSGEVVSLRQAQYGATGSTTGRATGSGEVVSGVVSLRQAQYGATSSTTETATGSTTGYTSVVEQGAQRPSVETTGKRFREFGPGYFDLVIIDEAHRSVYAKYGEIFRWFDALLIGLTATPKDEIDHNTYSLFDLEDGMPTDVYGLAEAVADHHLVPARSLAVPTQLLHTGIRYSDLSESEQEQWDLTDWGDDEGQHGSQHKDINATQINSFCFNKNTNDQVLAYLMEHGIKVAGGEQLGKTIIFARNQDHAEFIKRIFDQQYPQYGGTFARVITSNVKHAQKLIDDFSNPSKEPTIAISVDMLDTGIDIPEVVNLVFFKPIYSKTKFWQMIGRGTRLRPDLFGPGEDKKEFLVLDVCGNLEFFAADVPELPGTASRSLSARIVAERLALLRELDRVVSTSSTTEGEVVSTSSTTDLRNSAAQALHRFVAGMNRDNFIVRPHLRLVEKYADLAAWDHLSDAEANEVTGTLATLPSAAGMEPSGSKTKDPDALRLDLLALRGQVAALQRDTATLRKVQTTIQAIATELLTLTAIPEVQKQATLLSDLIEDEWWDGITAPLLELVRLRIRGLVRFIEHQKSAPVYTNFTDSISGEAEIELPNISPGVNTARFREKAQHYLNQHLDKIALQKLRRNRQLTNTDIAELEHILLESGVATPDDIESAAVKAGGLGIFIRSLIGLDASAVEEAFAAFIYENSLNVDQINYLKLIKDELSNNGIVDPSRLFETPYTDIAFAGPDLIFPDAQLADVVTVLRTVKERAVPVAKPAASAL